MEQHISTITGCVRGYILLVVCFLQSRLDPLVQYANPPKVQIYLYNNQQNSTGGNFQQMITFNSLNYSVYEASNLGNIRFYQGSSELYSWCESSCSSSLTNTIFWVKIPNGIAAMSIAQINLTFAATTSNYDDNYAGQAPSLSSGYGMYDNGAKVFSLYFDGNTNPSAFGPASGVTVAQATGVTYGSSTINAIQVTGVYTDRRIQLPGLQLLPGPAKHQGTCSGEQFPEPGNRNRPGRGKLG